MCFFQHCCRICNLQEYVLTGLGSIKDWFLIDVLSMSLTGFDSFSFLHETIHVGSTCAIDWIIGRSDISYALCGAGHHLLSSV